MENAARKLLAAQSLKYKGAVALISNGSVVLLKYKLNNVCDADNRPANGAQKTECLLYTTIYCGCQYESADILHFLVGEKANTHYLRIKCVLQAHHENNAYYVRIKSVFMLLNYFC